MHWYWVWNKVNSRKFWWRTSNFYQEFGSVQWPIIGLHSNSDILGEKKYSLATFAGHSTFVVLHFVTENASCFSSDFFMKMWLLVFDNCNYMVSVLGFIRCCAVSIDGHDLSRSCSNAQGDNWLSSCEINYLLLYLFFIWLIGLSNLTCLAAGEFWCEIWIWYDPELQGAARSI